MSRKFKVGDRVRITGQHFFYPDAEIGAIFTVRQMDRHGAWYSDRAEGVSYTVADRGRFVAPGGIYEEHLELVGDTDTVNHPEHYKRGGMEAIDVIEAFGLNYHLASATKYILRAGHKGSELEDIKKAAWFLNRYAEKLEAGE